MKFSVFMAKRFYSMEKERKQIVALKKIGFSIGNASKEFLEITGDSEIELNSIEEIMDFIETHGKIVLDKDYSGNNCITIYNDYLE